MLSAALSPPAPVDPPCDVELMRRFYTGEEEAFEELTERWRKALYPFFRRLGFRAEDAEDLSQEALLRLYLTRDRVRFDPSQPLAPFLFTIARNLATAHWRRRSARPQEVVLETDPGAAASPVAETVSDEVLGEVLACAWRLPEPQLLYLTLCGLHGLGDNAHGEIAATLGRWPSQVSDLSQRAIRNLRRCLEQKGYRFEEATPGG